MNPQLYAALQASMGTVKIANEGEAFKASILADPYASKQSGAGRKRLRVEYLQRGETYRVCCPVCGDTRHRLYINHRWGTVYKGIRLWYLAHCFNEECHTQGGFHDMLKLRILNKTLLSPVIDTATEISKKVKITGNFIRLDKLPPDHAAARFMRDIRHFDPIYAGQEWNISWCDFSLVLPMTNRLFFPIFDYTAEDHLELVGGQGHWLDTMTLNGKPDKSDGVKWFTWPGTHVGQHLYNGYRAAQQDKLIVVVEGAFDAMRLGPEYAVALFGHTATAKQKELLKNHWGDRGAAAVLILDPDMNDDKNSLELERWFMLNFKKFKRLKLPGGVDPDDMAASDLWTFIMKALQ